ncbi:hypothetical protein Tco_0856701 [Tanacetum coccineum]|uniref:Uncharacterized protein n=1 Tax=Tanacetum coccineum TaxID=301880 RepID=A0ABQ5B8C4_9ASTR
MHLKSDSQALAYLRLSLRHGTSTRIIVVVRICPGGTTMADVSVEGEGGFDPLALVELTLPVDGNIVLCIYVRLIVLSMACSGNPLFIPALSEKA